MELNKLHTEFLEILELNKKTIYKISSLYCDNQEDKNDLFQEIVYNIWKSFRSFRNNSKISTWIYRISLNTAITKLRENTRQPKKEDFTPYIPKLIDNQDDDVEELYNFIFKAIESLGRIDKAIMILYLDRYSYDEIAQMVGITKTNVATKINRIKQMIKEKTSNK